MKEKEEMLSLNSDFSEFALQQLENRLETDPLAIGGLVELETSPDEPMPTCFGLFCPYLENCPVLT